MDRALIFVTLAFALVFYIAREGNRLTRERLYEIIIAIYTFSCCFARLFLPILKGDEDSTGSFGNSLSIWPFYAMGLLLLWIVGHQKQWRIRRPNLWLFFLFSAYAIYTLINPFNMARRQSLVEVSYLLSFAVFIYLFANSFSFFIYFVRLLNSILSNTLTFPITVTHSALRFLQNSDTIQTTCTSSGDNSGTKAQYNCGAQASSTINNIAIDPTKFNFGGKTINLKGDAISPLANKYLDNISKFN